MNKEQRTRRSSRPPSSSLPPHDKILPCRPHWRNSEITSGSNTGMEMPTPPSSADSQKCSSTGKAKPALMGFKKMRFKPSCRDSARMTDSAPVARRRAERVVEKDRGDVSRNPAKVAAETASRSSSKSKSAAAGNRGETRIAIAGTT